MKQQLSDYLVPVPDEQKNDGIKLTHNNETGIKNDSLLMTKYTNSIKTNHKAKTFSIYDVNRKVMNDNRKYLDLFIEDPDKGNRKHLAYKPKSCDNSDKYLKTTDI
jgi:hypothetical protein